MISREFYEFGAEYKDTIRNILINHSCGNIPIEYSEFLRKNGYSDCNCSAGIFNGTSRFYNQWLEAKAYYESEVKDEKTGKNTKTCKRKS